MSSPIEGPTAVIVSAMREEIAPLLARLEAGPELRDGALRLYLGQSGGRAVTAAVIGDGPIAAERGLLRLLEVVTPDRLLLIGFAGGLSDDLPRESLVQAASVGRAGGGEPIRSDDAPLAGIGRAAVVSTAHILSTAESKRQAWSALGNPARCVVDLESWGVVRQLQEAAVPWTVVRAVSDAWNESLPLDFAELSDPEGRIVRARVVRSLLRHPTALGSLLRLRSRARSCARELALVAVDWLSM